MLEGDEHGIVDEEYPASREGVYCTSRDPAAAIKAINSVWRHTLYSKISQ
jgi:hypothetical protein